MSLLDYFALGIFCICWVGFSYLVKYISGTNKSCLTKTLEYFRDTWMSEMLKEPDRVADIQTLGMFERNCNFFASSSLLIVAGLLTFLGSLDKAELIAQKFGGVYIEHISYKVIALLILFISSFFCLLLVHATIWLCRFHDSRCTLRQAKKLHQSPTEKIRPKYLDCD